ncbi:hypothetical protein GCM10008986_33060 [Salinibacillus aidingensis]|uniref:Uncharacterized protein n=1 Tax=Salinibacillus aidingensis TaxID=237684 RepID=A0ABN1BQF7_9BACI
MTKGNKKHNHEPQNIEVWEDLVHIKDLGLALLICGAGALGGYFLAPNNASEPLFYGLAGAVLGFIISSFIIKPKRTFEEIREEDQ